MTTIYALSVQQPFATAIIHCGKFIENRTWMPKCLEIGDKLAIVASKTWYPIYKDRMGIIWDELEIGLIACGATRLHDRDDYPLGGLIGLVTYGEALYSHWHQKTKWAMEGQCHWLLTDPQPVPFQPIKGRLGLYKINLC